MASAGAYLELEQVAFEEVFSFLELAKFIVSGGGVQLLQEAHVGGKCQVVRHSTQHTAHAVRPLLYRDAIAGLKKGGGRRRAKRKKKEGSRF